jgi:hypothetical protein
MSVTSPRESSSGGGKKLAHEPLCYFLSAGKGRPSPGLASALSSKAVLRDRAKRSVMWRRRGPS